MRWMLVMIVVGCGSKEQPGSRAQSRAATKVDAAPAGLVVKDNAFTCTGPISCKGEILNGEVRVRGAAGTVIRVAGTEYTLEASEGSFRIDALALADHVGIAALLDNKTAMTLPLEVTLPERPALRGSFKQMSDGYIAEVAQRLADISTKPLPKQNNVSDGWLVVVKPTDPNRSPKQSTWILREWGLRAVGTVESPSNAKGIILGTPVVSTHGSCGQYRDRLTGERVAVTLAVMDLELQAFDPATGKSLGTRHLKASRKCPSTTGGDAYRTTAEARNMYRPIDIPKAAEALVHEVTTERRYRRSSRRQRT